MFFSKYNFILDFYFNFLVSLEIPFPSKDNSFDKAFDNCLYEFILKNQSDGIDTETL